MFPPYSDSENEKSKSVEYSENVGDKTVDLPQPGEFSYHSYHRHSSRADVKKRFSQIQLTLWATLC